MSPEGFETRYTTELANEYGNLASRTLAMVAALPRRRGAGRRAGRRRSRREFDGPRRDRGARIDARRADRGARGDLAARQAPQPLRQDEEPWKLAKDEAEAERLDACSTRSPRGCAWSRCCSTPFMPRSAERLLAALGREDLGLEDAGSAPSAAARELGRARPAVPARRARASAPGTAVVDTHCHLDSCEPPDAELVERARAAGVDADRNGRHGRPVDRARRWRPRREHEGVSRSSAATRTRPRASAPTDLEGSSARRPTTPASRHRRDGARLLPRPRAARDQLRAFEAQLDLAARARAAGGHPHARRRGRHLRGARASTRPG